MSPMNIINRVLGEGFGHMERNIFSNIGGGIGGIFGGQNGQGGQIMQGMQGMQGMQNNFSNGTFGNVIGSVLR